MQMHIAPHPQTAMHPMSAGSIPVSQHEQYQGWHISERQVQRPIDSSWASEFNTSSSASQARSFMQTNMGSSSQQYSSAMQNCEYPMSKSPCFDFGILSFHSVSQNSYAPSQSFYQPYMGNSYSMGMNSLPSYNVMQDQGKGKGKSREESFEAAFAQYATSASITEVDDDISDLQEALKDVKLDGENAELGELKESDFERRARSNVGYVCYLNIHLLIVYGRVFRIRTTLRKPKIWRSGNQSLINSCLLKGVMMIWTMGLSCKMPGKGDLAITTNRNHQLTSSLMTKEYLC